MSTESSTPPSFAPGPVAADLLAAIATAAAERADVPVGDVRLLTAEEVTWSDSSLGCPAPGMAYTQALVPGYRVVMEAGGEELHFHGGASGDFRYCADPQAPAAGPVDR